MDSKFDLRKKHVLETDTTWTQEQDIYLIEHSHLSLEELCKLLPYSDHEILLRKKRLGLVRRTRQMNRLE